MDESVVHCEKVVSPKWRFVAVLVPKVARTSLLKLLTEEALDVYGGERQTFANQVMDSDRFSDWFRFGFVRNPWSRTVSAWKSKVQNPASASAWADKWEQFALPHGSPFEEFVAWLNSREGSDELADRHWASQHLMLKSEERGWLVDFVGRFESLEGDWDAVCQRVGMPCLSLGRHNVWSGGNWEQYYDSRLIEAVARRYATDIDLFGYSAPQI